MRAAKWGTRDSGMTQTHRGVFGCRFQRTHSECAHLRKRPAVSALSATLQVRSCSSVSRRLWGRISERRTLNDDRNSCWITNYEELAPRFILRAAVTTASTHRYAPSSDTSLTFLFLSPREKHVIQITGSCRTPVCPSHVVSGALLFQTARNDEKHVLCSGMLDKLKILMRWRLSLVS